MPDWTFDGPHMLAGAIAATAHRDQLDKNGSPYLAHPARVAMAVEQAHYDDEVIAVAWLHDVVEDQGETWPLSALADLGFSTRVLEAVDAISKRDGEPIDEYYARVVENSVAHAVKWFDVLDNSDEKRLALLDPKTAERLRVKYEYARIKLGGGPP